MTDAITASEEQKKYDTRRSREAWRLFFTGSNVFCDLLQYAHKEKYNLFVLYNKNKLVFCRIWGHEKRKRNLLTWSNVDLTPSMWTIIVRDQQPNKMYTEVRLLYKFIYIYTVLQQSHTVLLLFSKMPEHIIALFFTGINDVKAHLHDTTCRIRLSFWRM